MSVIATDRAVILTYRAIDAWSAARRNVITTGWAPELEDRLVGGALSVPAGASGLTGQRNPEFRTQRKERHRDDRKRGGENAGEEEESSHGDQRQTWGMHCVSAVSIVIPWLTKGVTQAEIVAEVQEHRLVAQLLAASLNAVPEAIMIVTHCCH